MPFLRLNFTTSNAEHLLRNRLNAKFSSFTSPIRVLMRLLGVAFLGDCPPGVTKTEMSTVKKACLVEQQNDRPRHKTSTRVTFNGENVAEACAVVESGRHTDSSSVKSDKKLGQKWTRRKRRILYGFKLACLISVGVICVCSLLLECFQAFFQRLPTTSMLECLCFLLVKTHGMSSLIFVMFFLCTKKTTLLRKGVGQISGGVGALKHSRRIILVMNICFAYLLLRSVALCVLEYRLGQKNFLRQAISSFSSRPITNNNFNVVLLDFQRNGSIVDKMLGKSIVSHYKIEAESDVWKILSDSVGSCTLLYLTLASAIVLPLFALPQCVLIAELSVLDQEFAHDNNKYQLAVIRHYVGAHQNLVILFRSFYTLLSVWISVQLLSTTSISMGALALLFKIKWSKQWNDVLFCLFALVDAISFTIFVYTTAAQLFRKLVTLKTYTYIMAYQCFTSDTDYCLKFCGLIQIEETFLLKFFVLILFLFSAIRINVVL